MAEWDEKTGKVRPTWKVRFTPWMTFWGCGIAGVLTAAIFMLTLVTGPGLDELNNPTLVFRGTVLIIGFMLLVFLVLGPTLAWGLGFMLRMTENKWNHILAFAILGMVLGYLLGNFIGVEQALAPAAGLGAGLARWVMNPYARII